MVWCDSVNCPTACCWRRSPISPKSMPLPARSATTDRAAWRSSNQRLGNLAVVAKGISGGLRHRVDGVVADQRLDVLHVAISWVLRPDRCPEGPLRPGPRGSEAPELLTTKQLEYPVTACPPRPPLCAGPGPGTCLRRGSIWPQFRRWLGMPRCLLRASTTGVTTASSEGRQPSCMSPTLSLRADKPKNRPPLFGAKPMSRLASRAHRSRSSVT
jgi:hypothetical protein